MWPGRPCPARQMNAIPSTPGASPRSEDFFHSSSSPQIPRTALTHTRLELATHEVFLCAHPEPPNVTRGNLSRGCRMWPRDLMRAACPLLGGRMGPGHPHSLHPAHTGEALSCWETPKHLLTPPAAAAQPCPCPCPMPAPSNRGLGRFGSNPGF